MFTTKKVADIYDQIASNFSLTRTKLSPAVKKLLPDLPHQAAVLDLGCGNGVLLTALPKDVEYTGVDISPKLIVIAQKLHPQNNFLIADLTDPAFWQGLGQFDFIVCLATLHHLPTHHDQLLVLTQINKHLKPGGVALISVWRLWKLKYLPYHISLRHLAIPFHSGPKRYFYAFTQKGLSDLVQQAGFRQISVYQDRDNLLLQVKNSV